MTTISHTLATGSTVVALLAAPQAATSAPAAGAVELGAPLAQAHAHNDYEHDRTLLDALAHGFTSVEADVWLVEGELRVAHDAWELADAPTLEGTYLDPPSELVSPNGKQLYPGYDGVSNC